MRRSRSSFDLDGALEKAAALTPSPAATSGGEPRPLYEGVALVSFEQTPAPSAVDVTPEAPPVMDRHDVESASTPMPPTPPSPTEIAETEATPHVAPLPPPPDLSSVDALVARCGLTLDWVTRSLGARDVFIADEHGLPIAGAIRDTERRLAAAGGVLASVRRLAANTPGNVTEGFSTQLGEGPVLALIGLHSGDEAFVLGMLVPEPLPVEHVLAVRAACRAALLPPRGAP